MNSWMTAKTLYNETSSLHRNLLAVREDGTRLDDVIPSHSHARALLISFVHSCCGCSIVPRGPSHCDLGSSYFILGIRNTFKSKNLQNVLVTIHYREIFSVIGIIIWLRKRTTPHPIME